MITAFRSLLRRHHLVTAIAVAVVMGLALLAVPLQPATRLVLAFDSGALVLLVQSWWMMSRATTDDMRRTARRFDEGEPTIIVLSVLAALFGLATAIGEFSAAKGPDGKVIAYHVLFGAGSLVLSWALTHTLFTLHYAHRYYGDKPGPSDADTGGLAFPETPHPDYWDFCYFAFTIGMTFQTSDTAIPGPRMRRLTLLHAVVSFLYNTVILALAINTAASLL